MARKITTPTPGDQLDFELVSAPGRVDQGAIVFDHATGLPMSRAAARSMTTNAIQTAMSKAIARLAGVAPSPTPAPPSAGAAIALDSLQVLWLIDKFSQVFDKPLVDFDKVDRKRWSTLDAVADLLTESIASSK